MEKNIQTIAVWPDGTWCYSELLFTCTYKSDDFELISFDENEHDPDDIAIKSNLPLIPINANF